MDNKFKAIYQDYDWCYERFITKGMSMKQMAEEANCTLRVMQKWCSEKYRLNAHTFKKEKHLTNLQKKIIMFGVIGDGHIDKREAHPLYIESHAENQKDYLYWKYNILKDLCAVDPIYKPGCIKTFNNKEYMVKPSYRLETRIIDDLKEIRNMSKIDIISQIDELGLCLLLLDDASRSSSNWNLCVAGWSNEEINHFIFTCKDRLNIDIIRQSDARYVIIKAHSSIKIDKWMLDIFPNDLDIIQYKIINNKDIRRPAFYIYVHTNNDKKSLSIYFKQNHLGNVLYNRIRQILLDKELYDIKEEELLKFINIYKNK